MKLRNRKTGEDGRLKMCHDDDKYPLYIEIGEIRVYYHNFAEMIEAGWECCIKPAEPLIKDEKIRKAILTWAKANDVTEVCYDSCWNEFKDRCFTISFDYDFDRHDGLTDRVSYTIAELCGEEE